MGIGSQDKHPEEQQIRCSWLVARLKGLVNGINPRWGIKTVYVSDGTGEIIRLEERRRSVRSFRGEDPKVG